MSTECDNNINLVKALSRRGSILTEGAIFMPFFIIAVITLLYLLKACLIDVELVTIMENELRKASIGHSLSISSGIREGLEYAGEDAGGLKVYSVPLPASDSGFSGAELVYAEYETGIHLPVIIRESVKMKNCMVYRNWDGLTYTGESMGFSAMASEGDGNIVYVFPRAGDRYHNGECRYVHSYNEKVTLDRSVRKKYRPCPLCCDGSEAYGTEVCVFRYGTSYHREKCDSVSKYVIEMDREDALIKGYTACSVCGGR